MALLPVSRLSQVSLCSFLFKRPPDTVDHTSEESSLATTGGLLVQEQITKEKLNFQAEL